MKIFASLYVFDAAQKHYLELNRNEYLRDLAKGKRVLHIGCSDFPITQQRIDEGTLLHQSLADSAESIVGIDLSEEGIETLKKYGFRNVFEMDAEDLKISNKFDLILAGDVLEHLSNPGLFLQHARKLLHSNGELVIGVPSAHTLNNLKVWFLGREEVHTDHTFYFSPKTISSLCSRYYLLPTKLLFTVQPPNANESRAFTIIRRIVLTICRSMAPSIILHFKRVEDVDQSQYFEWR